MRRSFIFGNFDTWYDWRCTLTGKDIQAPEPKTNYVTLDGVSGSLDLTEALTGEVEYNDRTVTATFMCSEGGHQAREYLLRQITASLHGRRVQIVEPDDPDHYFEGRVKITNAVNRAAYLEFTVEAICDPWRYAQKETIRTVVLTGAEAEVVITNEGTRTLCPDIAVTGSATLTYEGVSVTLTEGSYEISDVKLQPGATVVRASGDGTVSFIYREVGI